jgi:hypothetical protein
MKHAWLALLVMSTMAFAQPKKAPSRSVIAARGWISAMTDPKTIEPMSYSKQRPLEFKVQSDQAACAKLTKGKATTQPEIRALKACFVATWNFVAKEAELDVEDLRKVALDGEQLRWAKTAPKGTTWVGATRQYGGQDLSAQLALGPDYTVLAVWFVYLENDGE